MTTIVESVEISRAPADVFAYVTDPSHLPEWQASVIDIQQDDGPVQVGKRAVVTRKAGPPRDGIDGGGCCTRTTPHVVDPRRGRIGAWKCQRTCRASERRQSIACDDRTRPSRSRHREASSPARRESTGETGDAPEHAEAQGATRKPIDAHGSLN